MVRAQGSLEYMVIIAVILAVSAVVITYSTSIIGGQTPSISATSCKQAAIDCKAAKMLSPNDPCIACNSACKDSKGVELFDGATYCCTSGQPDMIYPNSSGCGGGYTVSKCRDGTLKANCSTTKPKYCDLNLELVDDCVKCGCPLGYWCNTTSKTCYPACSDGTPYNGCSSPQPKYCKSGYFIDNCTACGCPSGYLCNSTTNACYVPVIPKDCADGTPHGSCSVTKPLYCDNGNLSQRCDLCNCSTGFTCNNVTKICECSDGTAPSNCSTTLPLYCNPLGQLVHNCTFCNCPVGQLCNTTTKECYIPRVMAEIFYDEFSSLSAWSGDIISSVWRLNLTSGYNNSNSAFKDAYGAHYINHTQSTFGYTNISVSFWALNRLQDSGEYLRLEWFNGSVWINLGNLPRNSSWRYYSYNLPVSASNNTKFAIRFACYDWHQNNEAEDWCQVDTVRIRAMVPSCSDGTPLGQCSSLKPKYCNYNGELVNNCAICGCPSSYIFPCCCSDLEAGICNTFYSCESNGSCASNRAYLNCTRCSSGCCIGNKCGSIC